MPKRRVVRHEVTQPQDPSYRLIPLTKGQNAIVDTEDFAWLSKWDWRAHSGKGGNFYAIRGIGILMHRAILRCKKGETCDHKDGNTLNNRKENIRKCSNSQNLWNRGRYANNKSGFKGVYFRKETGKWRAMIGAGWRRANLGSYDTAEEAARAYDEAAKISHEEFAHLNFP